MAVAVPTIALKNAAAGNVLMPIIGQGLGGYTGNASVPFGTYPECFNGCYDAQCLTPDPANFSGCAVHVQAAVFTFLKLGGPRLDGSASYHNQLPMGVAVRSANVSR